jgi:DNA polymerase-3 subunit beta
MHILTKKEILLENIKVVEKAIPFRTSLAIIDGVYLEADKKLTFLANNLELSIKADDNKSQIKEKGKVVLPRMFIDVIKQLPGEDVEIITDKESLVTNIYSERSKICIYGINAEEFPIFTLEEEWTKWSCLEFSVSKLKNILKKITFAISQEEGKPAFKGVLMEINEEGFLNFISSDTYRMARYQFKLEKRTDPFRLLIPGKNLNEIYKIIEDPNETIKFYINDREMIIVYKQFTISTRLMEDIFPDLNHIFPQTFESKIVINRVKLEKIIARASLFAQDNKEKEMIMLQINNNCIEVHAASETGKIDEDLILDKKEGKNLTEIYLNVRYFLDPFLALEEEKLCLEFNGNYGPCIFKTVDEQAENMENYRYLVLPIKLNK